MKSYTHFITYNKPAFNTNTETLFGKKSTSCLYNLWELVYTLKGKIFKSANYNKIRIRQYNSCYHSLQFDSLFLAIKRQFQKHSIKHFVSHLCSQPFKTNVQYFKL